MYRDAEGVKNYKLQVTGHVWCQSQDGLPAPGLMNTHLHDIAAFLTVCSEAVHFLTVHLHTKALSVIEGEGRYTLLYLCFKL